MSELPPGWEWANLEDLAGPTVRAITDGPFGSNLKSEHYTESGARVIRLQNIGDGQFRDERTYISLERFESLRNHEVREGDLIVASLGETPPRACLVPALGEPAIVKADCIRIRLSSQVDARWVLYALTSPQAKKFAATLIKGVGRPRLGLAHIRALRVPVPPLAEQRRVVAEIEHHFSDLDAAERLLDSVDRRTEMAGKSLLAAALSGKIVDCPARKDVTGDLLRQATLESRRSFRSDSDKRGRPDASPPIRQLEFDIPDHWSVVSLEEATHPNRTISYGILKPGPNLSNGIPYVRVINMRGDQIATEDLHRTSREIEQKYARARLAPADVLLSIRGTFGRVAIVPDCLADASITQDTARLSFVDTVDPRFAAYYLRSPGAQSYFKKIARGVAVKGVNIGDLREMPMPLPSLTEQQLIVRSLDEFLSEVVAAKDVVQNTQRRVRQLRKTILLEAFAGRLVPQDPNDESASVLLERIKAERAAQPMPKRGRRVTKNVDQGSML
ncbi:MAG: restriction endonuclease subunit S [Pseudonocardiaceae bacterium]